MIAEYLAGQTIDRVAAAHSTTYAVVELALRRHGIPKRPTGSPPRTVTDAERARVLEQWQASVPIEEIAAGLRTRQSRIREIVAEAGLATKRRFVGRRDGVTLTTPRRPKMTGARTLIYRRVNVPNDSPFVSMRSKTAHQALEHRIVMAQVLGRPLHTHETVHHINGDTLDNRPENLQLHTSRHGKGVVLRCRCCGSQDIEVVAIDHAH